MLRILLLTLAVCAAPALAAAQHDQPPASDDHRPSTGQSPRHAAPAEAGGEEGPAEAVHTAEHGAEGAHHEETIWGPISRLFNFLVLAGTLFYFLRTPIATYLSDRKQQIASDLVTATETKAAAEAQLAELDRRMAALPGELDALKARGQQEIAAEEARIEEAAAAERERLLEQTRREIDLQLRIAQRELVEHASNLAVGLATDRIKKDITPADQARLVDRYLEQVKR